MKHLAIFHMNPLPDRGFTGNILPYFLRKIKIKKINRESAKLFILVCCFKGSKYGSFGGQEHKKYTVETQTTDSDILSLFIIHFSRRISPKESRLQIFKI